MWNRNGKCGNGKVCAVATDSHERGGGLTCSASSFARDEYRSGIWVKLSTLLEDCAAGEDEAAEEGMWVSRVWVGEMCQLASVRSQLKGKSHSNHIAIT